MLPDEVLLSIFELYTVATQRLSMFKFPTKWEAESWQPLVHVCRRWRTIVFGSPRRLKLRIACTSRTPVRDALDIWPALPLVIVDSVCRIEGLDDIIAALKHRDRVDEIYLGSVSSLHLARISATLQEPFPEMKFLCLHSYEQDVERMPVLPDSFLGGSAPHLRDLQLDRIRFSGLPNLLLSATHLTRLDLRNIPHSGYVSPKSILIALSTLTTLESLSLHFRSPQSHRDWESRCPPVLTRSVFPVLTMLTFMGISEHLDDLVAHIDAPQLHRLDIILFNQIIFHTPQFIRFISRTPTLKFERGHIGFDQQHRTARIQLSSKTSSYGVLYMGIRCSEFDWQVSSLEQVVNSCLPSLSMLEDLYIYERLNAYGVWGDNFDNTLWLELIQPFTAVKNLYLSRDLAPRIALALQELVGAGPTEVLPTLQNIFLEGFKSLKSAPEGIRQFSVARKVANHPITVSLWKNTRMDKTY